MISRRRFTQLTALVAAAPMLFVRRARSAVPVVPDSPAPAPTQDFVLMLHANHVDPRYGMRMVTDTEKGQFIGDLLNSWVRGRRIITTVPFTVGGDELLVGHRVEMTASTNPSHAGPDEFDLTIIEKGPFMEMPRVTGIPNFYRRQFRLVNLSAWEDPRDCRACGRPVHRVRGSGPYRAWHDAYRDGLGPFDVHICQFMGREV